jgi:pyrroline-5-carboxylate reductase
MKKTLFIGGGKMMQAIAGGLIARGHTPADLAAVEPDAMTANRLREMAIFVVPGGDLATLTLPDFETIVLAVKPQVMREAIRPLAGRLRGQLVLSIAAGIRTTDLSAWLAADKPENTQIVRAMPNTPALIQAGISGLFAPIGTSTEAQARAETLLGAVGKTVWFEDESKLDAVTAISGSGPAYVFYFIEALEAAARGFGFTATQARQFALETFRGAALLASQSTDTPAQLRANVTSKGGTTAAAIAVFDAANLQAAFIDGVIAAKQRAHELGGAMAGTHAMENEKGNKTP